MKDICCIGHITHDRIITPQKTVDLAGGTSFYFARGLSCLPPRVSFQLVTKGGQYINDEVDRLRAIGVDVKAYPSTHTVFFENKYGQNSDNRRQRVLAKADPFTMEEIRPLQAKVFHLGSLLADDFPLEAVRQLSTKGRVSIDVQGYLREVRGEKVYPVAWKDKEQVLECTDYLKLNEHEMEVVASSRDPRTVALELASQGVGPWEATARSSMPTAASMRYRPTSPARWWMPQAAATPTPPATSICGFRALLPTRPDDLPLPCARSNWNTPDPSTPR